MAYLLSENVAVFPIAKERKQNIEETRLLTEYNISGIIRQLLSSERPGFVTSVETDNSGNYNVKFNLYGYQFDIDLDAGWLSENFPANSADGVYAYIVIDEVIDEIAAQDVDGKYAGLGILFNEHALASVTLESDQKLVHIKILDVEDGELKPIPKASFFSYNIGGLDGKYK